MRDALLNTTSLTPQSIIFVHTTGNSHFVQVRTNFEKSKTLLKSQISMIVPKPVNIKIQHVVRRPDLAPLINTKDSVGVVSIFTYAMKFFGINPILCCVFL